MPLLLCSSGIIRRCSASLAERQGLDTQVRMPPGRPAFAQPKQKQAQGQFQRRQSAPIPIGKLRSIEILGKCHSKWHCWRRLLGQGLVGELDVTDSEYIYSESTRPACSCMFIVNRLNPFVTSSSEILRLDSKYSSLSRLASIGSVLVR